MRGAGLGYMLGCCLRSRRSGERGGIAGWWTGGGGLDVGLDVCWLVVVCTTGGA